MEKFYQCAVHLMHSIRFDVLGKSRLELLMIIARDFNRDRLDRQYFILPQSVYDMR